MYDRLVFNPHLGRCDIPIDQIKQNHIIHYEHCYCHWKRMSFVIRVMSINDVMIIIDYYHVYFNHRCR